MVLRKACLATGVALVLLASQGVGALAATAAAVAAEGGASTTSALLDRVQTITSLVDQLGQSVQGVDFSAIYRTPGKEGIAAVVAQLDQAEVQATATAGRLRALPAWTGASEEDRMVAATTRDAMVYADDVVGLIKNMRQLLVAARNGDDTALQKAMSTLMSGGVKMTAGQALAVRARAAMLPRNSSDRQIVLAQAELYDGVAALLSYGGEFSDGAATAQALRRAETNIRRLAALGRECEIAQAKLDRAELADGLKDAALAAAFERQHRLQLDVLQSLERSAVGVGAIAAKLEAAGPERLRVRDDMLPIGREETLQAQLMQDQMAAYREMIERAKQISR